MDPQGLHGTVGMHRVPPHNGSQQIKATGAVALLNLDREVADALSLHDRALTKT